jgi:putative membrane protein insertion efficiency factor
MKTCLRYLATGWRGFCAALGWLMIGMVRLYQRLLSPLLGKNCRFTPTCSSYFIGAVQKYGPFKGALRGLWRIARCQPFNPGGYDPP